MDNIFCWKFNFELIFIKLYILNICSHVQSWTALIYAAFSPVMAFHLIYHFHLFDNFPFSYFNM
jgi:hypothetical protein